MAAYLLEVCRLVGLLFFLHLFLIVVRIPITFLIQVFDLPGQLVGMLEHVLQVFCSLFGLAGADYWHGRRYDSGRQPAEGLAGQGVHYGRGRGRAVGEELCQVLTDKVNRS